MDSLIKQLFSTEGPNKKIAELIFAGKGADPTLDRLDRVALSIAVKDNLYQKLLSHNKGVIAARKCYQERM